MRAHSGLAVGCLALGLADVLYLDLVVGPRLLGRQEAVVAMSGDQPTGGTLAVDEVRSDPAARAPAPVAVEVEPEPAAEPARPAQGRPEAAGRADPGEASAALAAEPIYIQFGREAAELDEEARAVLDRVAGELSARPALRAAIDGHADRRGEVDYNDALSLLRAERVAEYVASRGIAPARMTVRAFGERRPLDTGNGTASNRRNRRVDVRLSER